jgi:hypothetical protein
MRLAIGLSGELLMQHLCFTYSDSFNYSLHFLFGQLLIWLLLSICHISATMFSILIYGCSAFVSVLFFHFFKIKNRIFVVYVKYLAATSRLNFMGKD